MTLAAAWVRTVADTSELVIASDSRLRFGCAWDCAPKIITLPRGDSALCFAGDTQHAYPLMIQMRTAVERHSRSLSRALDLTDLKGHLLRIANGMREYMHDPPQGEGLPIPEVTFLLAGYSWKESDFCIWMLHYDASIREFTFRPATQWRGVEDSRKLLFAGDELDEATRRLIAILRDREKLTSGSFDMEPFEVLRDMIRSEAFPTIGGPPQLVKIYRHMNTLPYSIKWPNAASGKLTLLGRPLLDYERTQYISLDPDTLATDLTWSYNAPAGVVAG